MSFLKNNWHWMLFALTIFGGIGVALFIQLNTDTEPKTVYKLPSAETLQNIREKTAVQEAQKTDDTKRPPPPGETHETGYWHGDHWHRTAPLETQTPRKLNKEEIAKLYTKEEREYWEFQGLKPPPPGYTYFRVNGGDPKLYPKNQVNMEVRWIEKLGDMHQLSESDWQRYLALDAIAHKRLNRIQIPDDVAALALEWKEALYQKTMGLQPDLSAFSLYDRELTPEEEKRNAQLRAEARFSLEKPPRNRSVNHDVIDQVMVELQNALN